MGILCLSAHLKANLGNTVDIDFLDLRLENKQRQSVTTDELARFQPDLVAISLLSFEAPFLDNYLGTIRMCVPRAGIIIGGPYPTLSHKTILTRHPAIDCAVLGEGEVTLLNIVKRMMAGKPFKDVGGIAYRDGNEIVATPPQPHIKDLDTLGLPDYGLVDIERYCRYPRHMNLVLARKKFVPLLTSRGCPYKCAYCSHQFGHKIRMKSAETVFGEIQELHDRYGVEEFHIIDDFFNFDRDRMRAILDLIVVNGLNIKLAVPNGLRGDQLEVKDIDLLSQAGAYILTFAIESGSQHIQKMYRKNLNLRKVQDNINHAVSRGMITQGFFMLGFPGEAVNEIKQTIDFAARSRLHLALFFLVVPFPGTELFTRAQSILVFLDSPEAAFLSRTSSFYEQTTGYNLRLRQKIAYLKFYTPARLTRLLRRLPEKRCFLSVFAGRALRILVN